MERQAKLVEMKRAGKIPEDTNIDCFILFDDVMGIDEKLMKTDGTLLELFTAGRHFHITIIFCLQDAYGIPPKHRQNM